MSGTVVGNYAIADTTATKQMREDTTITERLINQIENDNCCNGSHSIQGGEAQTIEREINADNETSLACA